MWDLYKLQSNKCIFLDKVKYLMASNFSLHANYVDL